MFRPTALALLLLAPAARAGVHYGGDRFRPLPARWNGFLPDLRALRTPAGPLHDRYAAALAELERLPDPTADQLADRGALLLRLNQPARALGVLRPAARRFPDHFRLAANLGAAWHLLGDLSQAVAALDEAVRLAPAEHRPGEELHRRLVRERLHAPQPDAPDRLFPDGPPADAVARVQGLLLSLPGDGRLLWLLADLADAAGDVRAAAALLDGCVTEFNMASPAVRTRRQAVRTAADLAETREHAAGGRIAWKSPRAFARLLDPERLPAVRPGGTNPLPWAVLGETEIDGRGRPAFLSWLERLDGLRVELPGHMTPVGTADAEVGAFLLTEAAVGCWFCEVPGPTQAVRVELPDGATTAVLRGAVRVVGVLRLNRTDPEGLPVTISVATVRAAD